MTELPGSELVKISNNQKIIDSMIDRRKTMLSNVPDWQITRKDPDVENAALAHAKRLAEVTIPDNIANLEQQRAMLMEKREIYVQEHAPELIAKANEFSDQIAAEEKVVKRLESDLKRGFTTEEVVQRRRQGLRELELRKETDPDLQAGFELLSRPQDVVPDLLPQLGRITSLHEHKYDLDNTVRSKLEEARIVSEDERSPEQKQLLEDVAELGRYTNSENYQAIYSPDELHDLVCQLKLFSQKNRPDFNGLEEKILNLLKAEVRYRDRSDLLHGAIKRAEQFRAKRQGMQWNSLTSLASEASSIIRGKAMILRRGSVKMEEYLLTVHDPYPQIHPNLTSVYQAVVDMAVLDVIGKRSIKVDKARCETFVANCGIVNDWYKSASSVLQGLPDRPDVRRLCREIEEMIATMNIRLTGREVTGFGKGYKLDPAGAINLQKKIGFTVRNLNEVLGVPQGQKIKEGEIIPLE